MGDRDLVKPLLESCGAKVHFGRVKMKPGKPLTFATLDLPMPSTPEGQRQGGEGRSRRMLIFGLPGE